MSTAIANLKDYTDPSGLFKPINPQPLVDLFYQYRSVRADVERIADVLDDKDEHNVLRYFVDDRTRGTMYGANSREQAISKLDADFWQRAIALTDLLEIMPEKRRREWHEQLSDSAPPFTPDTVVATLQGLIDDRPKFLAERVDGCFQALSDKHVTNSPWGFNERMIVANVVETPGSFLMYAHNKGHFHDLRCAVARLRGDTEPPRTMTQSLLRMVGRDTGTWHTIDGGAMRVRGYKKGTLHIEVHPDMAWRLNAILAHLYPMALADESVRPPKKGARDFELIDNPIPFPVLGALNDAYTWDRRASVKADVDKHVRQRAGEVLEAIGGVIDGQGAYAFDYDYQPVLQQVIMSGALPDDRSHQYYPTPEAMADYLVSCAGDIEGLRVLEPSAGNGALVGAVRRRFPRVPIAAIEVSPLRCKVLRERFPDAVVRESDFLDVTCMSASVVFMNPPFSGGRWRAHLDHAIALLRSNAGGQIYAIVPSTANLADIDRNEDVACLRELGGEVAYPGVSIKVRMIEVSV